MVRDDIITGLDVGSTAVRAVVGQRIKGDGEGRFHLIGVAEVPSEGISKGVITSIEDAVSSISGCIEKAERMAGVPVEHAYVSISGVHVISQVSKGVIAVSKANGEINEDDVARVIDAAQAVATPPNYQILHVIPRTFMVDNQAGIKDPIGMTGVRLEVETQIIQGLSAQIRNLEKAIYRTGVDIDELVLSSMAAAESVLTKRQKDLGVALLNIGGTTTTMVVFEEGDVLHTFIVPLGSNHITADIAIGLRTSMDVADKIKLQYGSANPEDVDRKEEINLSEMSESEHESVSRKHVAEIIEARLEEIFQIADKELKKINRSGMLPSGVVLTGGGAKLPGVVDVAKKQFRLPASIGTPAGITSAIEKINDPVFAVAAGLVIWGTQQHKGNNTGLGAFSSDMGARVKKWFKSLIP